VTDRRPLQPDVLSSRVLNRATLERQLLLRRSSLTPLQAIEHLVGLQAQNPLDPYLALWTRLADFAPETVGQLLEERALVRMVVMRGTIHLVTADDAPALRSLTQPVLDAEIARHPEFAPRLAGVDLGPVLAVARAAMREEPRSGRQLRKVLAEHFPDLDAAALAYACRCLLPLVQVPPRGVWGRTREVVSTTLEDWLGTQPPPRQSLDGLLLRYLAAFGPATSRDAGTWSRLTGLGDVFDRLRSQLRTFRDERGRELFDLPDAPRPDPDTPAPVRFLPEYDNLLLSHADRARFGIGDRNRFAQAVHPFKGSVLVDGEVHAMWHSQHDRAAGRVVLVVEHLPLSGPDLAALEAEAERVVRFWHADVPQGRANLVPMG
jgi:hypothetical protein